MRQVAHDAPGQQFEGRIGTVIGVALCLALLHLAQEMNRARGRLS